MIRPIEIVIKDNEVKIIDLKVEETKTEKTRNNKPILRTDIIISPKK